ncbi:hypothetical protein Dimus_039202 [Dionaea muscipula]
MLMAPTLAHHRPLLMLALALQIRPSSYGNAGISCFFHDILSSVSDRVVPFISSSKTSAEALDTSSKILYAKTSSRVIGLTEQLSQPRGTHSITEYLGFIRRIADDLALIDTPVPQPILVLHVLNGIGPTFKDLAAAIRARDSVISFEKLHDKLVKYETFLRCEKHKLSPIIALASVATELTWIQHLLSELQVSLSSAPQLLYDNIGATYLCTNPLFHYRMKHIALDYHFVREKVASSSFHVAHVSTQAQLADLLTKPLPKDRFAALRSKINVADGSPILPGHIRKLNS